MSGVFLVAAKRTPFGSFGGSLKGMSATQLGVVSTQAALESANLDPSAVDSVFFGNVVQSSPDAAYLARHVCLKSGMKQSTPALTINRLCGSGFETVILGAHSIQLGESQISVCGGSENMSDAPLTVRGNDARWGVKLGTGLKMGFGRSAPKFGKACGPLAGIDGPATEGGGNCCATLPFGTTGLSVAGGVG